MSARVTDKALLALVDLIYEAACDPGKRWPELLRTFTCALRDRGPLVCAHDRKTMSATATFQGTFGCESLFLGTLLPHLARAAQIHHRFAFLQSLSHSSLAVLDAVPAAVVLLNASGRALHGNASAQAELRRADPFRLGPSREICVRGTSGAQASVRRAIEAALDPARRATERLSTVAQVPRRNGEMLSVQILPLPLGNCARRITTISRGFAACALVIHGAAAGIPTVGLQLLQHIYGLTPAEVKVALAIAEGETIKGYAERRRISRNTAASQLKRAFDKTGLRRQSELVRWLLQGGATLRPGTTATPAGLDGCRSKEIPVTRDLGWDDDLLSDIT